MAESAVEDARAAVMRNRSQRRDGTNVDHAPQHRAIVRGAVRREAVRLRLAEATKHDDGILRCRPSYCQKEPLSVRRMRAVKYVREREAVEAPHGGLLEVLRSVGANELDPPGGPGDAAGPVSPSPSKSRRAYGFVAFG